jgi:hypothetical protein
MEDTFKSPGYSMGVSSIKKIKMNKANNPSGRWLYLVGYIVRINLVKGNTMPLFLFGVVGESPIDHGFDSVFF